MNKRTFSGRTLDEALEAAVREYRKPREALNYRKLEEKKTLFGLEKTVVIEVLEEEFSPSVRTALNRIILSSGLSLSYKIAVEDETLKIDLSGSDLGLVLKNHGEVLDAVQTLISKIVQKQGWEGEIEVDGDSFRAKIKEKLQHQAADLCHKVKRENRSYAAEPLPPHLRKVVHLTVAKFPELESQSQGSGYIKRVIISPKKG
jgi:spoIIIJ-associated protein